MMEDLSRGFGQPLHWIQPKTFERVYELCSGESQQKYGHLEFPSTFGSLATAETSQGRWTFKRVGFFRTRVTVRREGEENDLAVYHPRWTGSQGSLEFAGGTVYMWCTVNFWATRFQFSDPHGESLVTYQTGLEDWKFSDLFKSQARVEVDLRAARLADLPVLVPLGWYLILLQEQDAAAATSAAAASSY